MAIDAPIGGANLTQNTGGAGNMGAIFESTVGSLGGKSGAIQDHITAAAAKEGGVTHEEMLNIQFEMGQYNAMLEMISSVTKSMTDMLNSLSKRTG